MLRRRASTPSSVSRSWSCSIEPAGPDTTDCVGPLITASESSSPSSGTTSDSGSGTASMAPDGRLSSILPRSTTSCTASGRERTPATHGRGVGPQAVAHDRGGLHAPALPEPRHRVLDDEHRGLADAHPAHQARMPPRRRGVAALGVEHLAQVEPEERQGRSHGPVDLLAEGGLRRVQLAAHAHVLAALAGEHEDDRAIGGSRSEVIIRRRLLPASACSACSWRVRDDEPAVGDAPCGPPGASRRRRPAAPPGGRGGGARAVQVASSSAGRVGPTAPAAGAARTGPAPRGRLLEDRVGVGAADAERAHAGPPRKAGGLPLASAAC